MWYNNVYIVKRGMLMILFIWIPVMLIIYFSVVYSYKPALTHRDGLLLGVTINEENCNDIDVRNLVTQAKKQFNTAAIALFIGILPMFILAEYASWLILYSTLWSFFVFAVPKFIVIINMNYLYRLKCRRSWMNIGAQYRVDGSKAASIMITRRTVSLLYPGIILCLSVLGLILYHTVFTIVAAIIAAIALAACIILGKKVTQPFDNSSIMDLKSKVSIADRCSSIIKCITIISGVWTLSAIGAHYMREMNGVVVWIILGIILTILSLIVMYIYYCQRVQWDMYNLTALADGDLICDADIFWLDGNYNNPNDSRKTVSKRFGVGTSLNTAKTSELFNYGVIVITVLGTLFLGLFFLQFDYSVVRVTAVDGEKAFSISAACYDDEVKAEDIESVELLDEIPPISKKNGLDSNKNLYGLFSGRSVGVCRVYLYRHNEQCVIIRLKNETSILVNYQNADETRKLYEWFMEKLK